MIAWACTALVLSVSSPTPTFNRDVAPIVHARCATCHQRGGGAPFPLISHRDYQKRTRHLREVITSGFMPPWLPTSTAHPLVGSRALSAEERKVLLTWIEAGAPEGTGAPPTFKATDDEWPLGRPDSVLRSDDPYRVPAEGLGLLQTFTFDLPPIEGEAPRFARAIDFRPSNPRLIHGALHLVDTTGMARRLDDATDEPGYGAMGNVGLNLSGSIGGWVVGGKATPLPKGYGWPIPVGHFTVQTHLNPIGREAELGCEVALYWAKEKVTHPVASVGMTSLDLDIAPGVTDYTAEDTYELSVEAHLVGVVPIAHYVCRTLKLTAELPTASDDHPPEVRELLRIDDWDLNWQEPYRYEQPIVLPRGTKIRMLFTYDNSADNPRNPNVPPQHVTLGRAPDNELAAILLHLAPAKASDFEVLEKSHADEFQRRLRERREKKRSR